MLSLTAPFLLSEINQVFASCEGNKSPGLDGFNLSLFKRFWPLLMDCFRVMFDQFFQFVNLPCSFSSYFATLILKIDTSVQLGDFRPISLVGSLYEILTEVLQARIYGVIDKLIFLN